MAFSIRRSLIASLLLLLLLAFTPLATPLFAQTSLDIDLDIVRTIVQPATGEVIVIGTVSCSQAANTFVNVALTQPVGRTRSVSGSTFSPIACAGPDVRLFLLRVVAANGRFGTGVAYVNGSVQGCAVPGGYPYPFLQCDGDQVLRTVRLTRR